MHMEYIISTTYSSLLAFTTCSLPWSKTKGKAEGFMQPQHLIVDNCSNSGVYCIHISVVNVLSDEVLTMVPLMSLKENDFRIMTFVFQQCLSLR